MRRIKAVMIKEFSHILRDPTSLTIVFLMPLLMMMIFSYAVRFDLDAVETGIVDYDQERGAEQLINSYANNNYFRLLDLRRAHPRPLAHGEDLIRSGRLKQVVVIPADFSRRVARGEPAEVGIIIDGSDAKVASLIYQYNEMLLREFSPEGVAPGFSVSTTVHFNPELKSHFFFIPGIVAILLVMVAALLTSVSLAREKESGSIDLLFISPLRSWEIILGKTLPYLVVGLLEEVMILAFARFWFHIPFRGDPLVLLLFSILYILAGLALGILVSTIASSQKSAMFAALIITLLPSIMLSGFIFPLESLAPVIRAVSLVVPARYFLEIIRGVILKGGGINHFLVEGLALAGFSLILLTGAMARFQRIRRRHL
ncbi:MAG TPA: ABC transporter permease [Candidatus Aminicenantes bacterium]|nr:ABC transporter permease [Candidatus Aminicenantes bacterium]